jgi:shikimate kinase
MAHQHTTSDDSLIFLVGFMGAGKTTVGRALASELEYKFLDLDELIEARTGKSVQAIFAELGEAEFRRLESEAISSCDELKRAVVALGGGAYISEENRTKLRSIGETVWLDCPLQVCLRRVGGDESRPLLGSRDEMRVLFEGRRVAYSQADYVVAAGEGSPEEIARVIISMLASQPRSG